jgi:hypothetical protein
MERAEIEEKSCKSCERILGNGENATEKCIWFIVIIIFIIIATRGEETVQERLLQVYPLLFLTWETMMIHKCAGCDNEKFKNAPALSK